MLRAYTAAAIRGAEHPLLEAGYGSALMQRAAYGLAGGVLSVLRTRGSGVYGSRVVLLIGSGNNGADALYAGAYLAARGARTTALLTSARTHPDALLAFQRAGGRVIAMAEASSGPSNENEFFREAKAADVIVDGLLGIGGEGGLREPLARVVAQLNQIKFGGEGPSVVACDLPSGVDASTGEVHGPVLAADLSITFGAIKTGLITAPGEQLCGRVLVVDIGLGDFLAEPDVVRLETQDLAELLPTPLPSDHKYSRGVAGIVAGSRQYPGAALLAVAAASACGPGMVRYLGDPAVSAALHIRNPEVVCSADSPEDIHVQAWLVGPGIDGDDVALERARLALTSRTPTVVDAGALALLSKTAQPFGANNSHLILTPHAGELSTLLARFGITQTRAEIENAPLSAARLAASRTGATVLLKGPTTVVAAPNGTVFTQADGTPRLATAGSGDTLSGIMVALLAMSAQPGREALGQYPGENRLAVVAALAAALHGRLTHEDPDAPLNAGQLAARIPALWSKLTH